MDRLFYPESDSRKSLFLIPTKGTTKPFSVRIETLPSVLSRSGGLAIMAADTAGVHGFRLHPFERDLQKQIYNDFHLRVIGQLARQ